MEPNTRVLPNSFFFFLNLICIFVTARAGIQYQILTLHPLPQHQILEFDVSWSELETAILPETTGAEPGTASHAFLPLSRIDALLGDKLSAKDVHKLRLQRDARRVQTILAKVAGAQSRNNYELDSNSTSNDGGKNYNSSVVPGLQYNSGEFFSRLGVGTPSQYSYFILDTGSDLIWLQSKPCTKCYKQLDKIFEPAASKSFSRISCNSSLCDKLPSPLCKANQCTYEELYGDGSFTRGGLGTETLSLRGNPVEKVVTGFGSDNEGLFSAADGLLGLGRGPLSFPSQTKSIFNGMFSYCLTDMFDDTKTKGSWVLFGKRSITREASFTPILSNGDNHHYYYAGLTGIRVGGKLVEGIEPSLFKMDEHGEGGVIVDSGTSVTRLTKRAYNELRDAFLQMTRDLRRAESNELFDTCYDLSGMESVKVPTVELLFGKLNMTLPPTNYVVPMDDEGTYCFAFAATTASLSIIGNIQQQGFRVVYDLEKSRLGFAPNEC